MIAALRFLTRLPLPGGSGPARSVPWFPAAGVVLGALGAGAYLGLAELLPDPVARAAAMAALIWLYAAFHLDGVSDCADAFYAGRDREDALRILADPRAGVMGVLAIACVLGLKAACLFSTDPRGVVTALPATIVAGHSAMAWALAFLPRGGTETSSARIFEPRRVATLVAIGLACAAVAAFAGPAGAIMLPLGAFAAASVARLAVRKLGGVNGDACGAIGQWTETAAWLGWAAADRLWTF